MSTRHAYKGLSPLRTNRLDLCIERGEGTIVITSAQGTDLHILSPDYLLGARRAGREN